MTYKTMYSRLFAFLLLIALLAAPAAARGS
jgi:hypothetical protein